MALDIVPITLAEANEFVRQKHRHHGKVAGHKFSIAVADVETSKIVGVAIVGRPVSRFMRQRGERQGLWAINGLLHTFWKRKMEQACELPDGSVSGKRVVYAGQGRESQRLTYIQHK